MGVPLGDRLTGLRCGGVGRCRLTAVSLSPASWRIPVSAPRRRWRAKPCDAAAREVSGTAKLAALAAGQAGGVAHVAAHDLGAAAYAIRAAREAAPASERDEAARQECAWQRGRLPAAIRDLVIDDQRRRNDICWGVFAC